MQGKRKDKTVSDDKDIVSTAFEQNKWKPGQSGNPKGMQKGTKHLKTKAKELSLIMNCEISAINPLLQELNGDESKEKYTLQSLCYLSMIREVIVRGNSNAFKNLMDILTPLDETSSEATQPTVINVFTAPPPTDEQTV
jgi:hypothetical protein